MRSLPPTAVALVIALLAHTPLVSAGEPAPPGPGAQGTPPDRPCRADLDRYCKDVRQGGGLILECLVAHRDRLQPACRARIDRIGQTQGRDPRYTGPVLNPKQLRACRNDVRTLCSDVAPGRGRWQACLQKHEAALSGECRGALASTPPAGGDTKGPTPAGSTAKTTPAAPDVDAAATPEPSTPSPDTPSATP